MSNAWFQFKQFRVAQDQCAMKVSTDACLFGAWIPLEEGVKMVLDVGTGTGLLSLMLAQRFPNVSIHAIEISADAAWQAAENFAQSTWGNRLKAWQQDVCAYQPSQLYDAIVCNPPFFKDALKSPDAARNLARHSDDFSAINLLVIAENLLKENGCIYLILPKQEHYILGEKAKDLGWQCVQKLEVRPRISKAVNRVCSVWRKEDGKVCKEEELIIYGEGNDYTFEALEMLKAFYLKL